MQESHAKGDYSWVKNTQQSWNGQSHRNFMVVNMLRQ